MSDLNELKSKTQEGADWRGSINVNIDDEDYELTVRQLYDREFEEVMGKIDREELQSLRDALPEDVMDEYTELRDADELTEEEEERLSELQDELEDEAVDIFDVLSSETFEGIRLAAKTAVVPDEEDLRTAFRERAAEIESEYGVAVKTPEDVKPALNDEIDEMIEQSTGFVSFAIGIQALTASVDDEGN